MRGWLLDTCVISEAARASASSWLAATALEYGLAPVTHTVDDFTPAGVEIADPWQ
ncbi:MAG: hypothetical protein WB784_05780 [Rhodanobacteraceae bacterium]